MAGLELQHAQTQSLELRAKIAPQMQQSLNVLQATTLELNQMIGQELAQNPVLEEESVDISVETRSRVERISSTEQVKYAKTGR